MPPLTILIKPASGLCNMRCQYCFYADVASRREGALALMDEAVLIATIRSALAHADGCCQLMFQGGEPTLAGLPFFERVVALTGRLNGKNLPVSFAIQTNGLLIDEDWARFLSKRRFLVGLSMDGGADIHDSLRPDAAGKGTWRRVDRAAQLLSKHGCEYNILTVVGKSVARHGGSVYNQLKKHRHLQFIPCMDDLDGAEKPYSLTPALYGQFLCAAFDAYFEDIQRGQYTSVRNFDNYVGMLMGRPPENCAMSGRCSANPVVEHDGSVYPCDFYCLDEWRLGNIQEEPLADLLAGDRARAFEAFASEDHPDCRACQWMPLCRGGCRRDYAQDRNRYCIAYKKFFEHSYPRLQQIARRARAGMITNQVSIDQSGHRS